MMKKRNMVLLAAALLMLWTVPAQAEEIGPGVTDRWMQEEDGRWYYINTDGSHPISCWKEIEDKWYYFDADGYMVTGWINWNGQKYWTDDSGAMAADTTLTIDGLQYTFGPGGVCLTSYKAPTEIPPEEEKSEMHHSVDAMADEVLAGITNDSMSLEEKARAIYSWVRGNLRYVNRSEKGDWVKAAYDGFRRKSGDCYTYYSVSLALLSRAGIPSIEVVRLDGHHWWNLINCGDGWYHFDTTPRSAGGTFCLLTDQELLDYSNRHVTSGMPYGSHGFDRSIYPPTPAE